MVTITPQHKVFEQHIKPLSDSLSKVLGRSSSYYQNLLRKARVNKNRYLLQLRDDKKNIAYPNSWGFFGGAFKKKETAEKCIIRELYEELLINSEISSRVKLFDI
mgnify:CR=1 FL=1